MCGLTSDTTVNVWCPRWAPFMYLLIGINLFICVGMDFQHGDIQLEMKISTMLLYQPTVAKKVLP
jgi:hypothetical protein